MSESALRTLTKTANNTINMRTIQLRLRAVHHTIVQRAAEDIRASITSLGLPQSGIIPLPTHIKKYTVIRSPFVDKRGRDVFERRTHTRLLEIGVPEDVSDHTLDIVEKCRSIAKHIDVDAKFKIKAWPIAGPCATTIPFSMHKWSELLIIQSAAQREKEAAEAEAKRIKDAETLQKLKDQLNTDNVELME